MKGVKLGGRSREPSFLFSPLGTHSPSRRLPFTSCGMRHESDSLGTLAIRPSERNMEEHTWITGKAHVGHWIPVQETTF